MNKVEEMYLKKAMTKKRLREYMAKQRSVVGGGMNTGTRTYKCLKEYNRNRIKNELRKMEGMWFEKVQKSH